MEDVMVCCRGHAHGGLKGQGSLGVRQNDDLVRVALGGHVDLDTEEQKGKNKPSLSGADDVLGSV